jgi:hypothetical protein
MVYVTSLPNKTNHLRIAASAVRDGPVQLCDVLPHAWELLRRRVLGHLVELLLLRTHRRTTDHDREVVV